MIKINRLYRYDNGFDEITIVISLENEKEIRYDSDTVYNPEHEIINVLENNKVRTVFIEYLWEI